MFKILLLLLFLLSINNTVTTAQTVIPIYNKLNKYRLAEVLQNCINKNREQSNEIDKITMRKVALLTNYSITKANAALYDSQLEVIKNQNNKEQDVLEKTAKKTNKYRKIKKSSEVAKSINTEIETHLVSYEIREANLKELNNAMNITLKEKAALIITLQKNGETTQINQKLIQNISVAKDSMQASGEISTATIKDVSDRIDKYKQKESAISNELNTLITRVNDKQDYSNNSENIKYKIYYMDSVVNTTAQTKQYSFAMIETALRKSTKKMFSLAAFFGPGGHEIPVTKLTQAKALFSPVVDSLIKFANQYTNIPRIATIVVDGYADGSNIAPTSTNYTKLVNYLGNTTPTKENLNTALSAMRASEMSKLFDKITEQKAPYFKNNSNIAFQNIELASGEKLPSNKIKNYKENDERRRIVIVYWSVLPND